MNSAQNQDHDGMDAIAPSGRHVRLTPELIERSIRETADKVQNGDSKRDLMNNKMIRRMMYAMNREQAQDSLGWERSWIMRELQENAVELVLERVQRRKLVCQAVHCLIETLSEQHGASSNSTCAFLLRPSEYTTRQQSLRFYHVHCFETIVQDPARFVKPPRVPKTPERAYLYFPASLYNWAISGGHVHDLDKYNDDRFQTTMKVWTRRWRSWHRKWSPEVQFGAQL